MKLWVLSRKYDNLWKFEYFIKNNSNSVKMHKMFCFVWYPYFKLWKYKLFYYIKVFCEILIQEILKLSKIMVFCKKNCILLKILVFFKKKLISRKYITNFDWFDTHIANFDDLSIFENIQYLVKFLVFFEHFNFFYLYFTK